MPPASPSSGSPSGGTTGRPAWRSAAEEATSDVPSKDGFCKRHSSRGAAAPSVVGVSKGARWLVVMAVALWLIWMVFLVVTALRVG